jgi:V/A-type H+-transporting ATPase subunit E
VGLEKIIDRIRKDAQYRVEEIESNADKEIILIANEAKNRADEGYARILKEAEKETDLQVRKILAQARLDARQHVRIVKESILSRCFQIARDELVNFRNKDVYAEVLDNLIRDAINVAGGGHLEVYAVEQDLMNVQRSVERIRREGFDISVASACVLGYGGIILHAQEGRIAVDNTFETRLNRQRHHLTSKIYEILLKGFEEK